ncbi:DgyrCDS1437 [Dimorphilus gyrociliatus]|uniref:DgyrCDS1437 n=1 Tax=Dimorphilus gyrociliatus TaxID=2664684 RepID=A0A7I8VA74_9ANNE|nr:DgyrCDS1437 [Dimorphilus gyrociliatus]
MQAPASNLGLPLYTTTTHYVPSSVQIDYAQLAQVQMIQATPQLQPIHAMTATTVSNANQQISNQVIHSKDLKVSDEDKSKILKHPLLQLVGLLLEKCESSTNSENWPNSASVNEAIGEFIRQHAENGADVQKCFTTDDADLDDIMMDAIQVLRIHLFELEKVNELCQDFCSRYTSCLKGKLKSSKLLKSDDEDEDDDPTPSVSAATNTIYQMVQTAQGLVAQPISVQQNMANADLQSSLLDDKDKKRGVLPKSATQIMKTWLFQHIVHPYPTEEEKRQIAAQTNLTLLQVNNWFINARRRILQPMLDSSDSKQPTQKKKTPATQSRPQRFWPDKLANLRQSFSESNGNDLISEDLESKLDNEYV